ncbi:MAG: ATP-binding cassette domain-containing protein, partial [Anaerolineales bacterium]|nr:ATP-binding cassette domain-containing protein [Anaerolineales bacterium]
MEALLQVKNLTTRFYTDEGTVHAVNGISYDMEAGETLGVVGESGCGKTVHALSIMRLIPTPPGKIDAGEIIFDDGRDLLKLSPGDMRLVRGAEIAMVFQDPMTSLNPVFTVGSQIVEALKIHFGMAETEANKRAG